MTNIVLYGAGGFGKEVAYIIERVNEVESTYHLLGFLDDGAQYHEGLTINGYPWLGTGDWIIEHKDECIRRSIHRYEQQGHGCGYRLRLAHCANCCYGG